MKLAPEAKHQHSDSTKKAPEKMQYRKEIDGLRAVAVLAVVLFHASIPGFSGGYIGVDIFFVISGYLITGIMLTDIINDQFSLIDFYRRRVRRLVPALLVILTFSWLAAIFLLAEKEFSAFSLSLLSTLSFSANIYFWKNTGYFDPIAEDNPLLHTWSLAIEEQFYIFFPFALLMIKKLRLKAQFLLVLCITVISFFLNLFAADIYPSAAFYLLPTRGWEMLMGSLCAYIAMEKTSPRFIESDSDWLIDNMFAGLGILLILYCIVFYEEAISYPSFYALAPTLGACLIILFGHRNTVVARFLGVKPLVFLGLISYSVYLLHQPIFAFSRSISLSELSLQYTLMLIALTLVTGWLSWKFVEVPYRQLSPIKGRSLTTIMAPAFLGLSLVGAIGGLSPATFNSGAFNNLNEIQGYRENDQLRDASWEPLKKLAREQGYEYTMVGSPFDLVAWHPPQDDQKKSVLVVGNSFSKDIFNALSSQKPITEAVAVARFGEQLKYLSTNREFWRAPNYLTASVIILASRMDDEDVRSLKELLERMNSDGKKVVVMSNVYEFPDYRAGRLSLIDVLRWRGKSDPVLINQEYYSNYISNRETQPGHLRNLQILDYENLHNFIFLDRMDLFCDDVVFQCYAVAPDGAKNLYDYGHLTETGARFLGEKLIASSLFELLQSELDR